MAAVVIRLPVFSIRVQLLYYCMIDYPDSVQDPGKLYEYYTSTILTSSTVIQNQY